MGRPLRVTEPGFVYHVLNRCVMRLPLFASDDDYLAFERVLDESLDRPDAPGASRVVFDAKPLALKQWGTVTEMPRWWHSERAMIRPTIAVPATTRKGSA